MCNLCSNNLKKYRVVMGSKDVPNPKCIKVVKAPNRITACIIAEDTTVSLKNGYAHYAIEK